MRSGSIPVALLSALAISACGGSKSSSAGGAPGSPGAFSSAGAPGGASAAPGGGADTNTSGRGSGGSPIGANGGSTNARVPATYVIRAGKVAPPLISVPAFLAIQLTAVSGDGKPHQVKLRARSVVTLEVPAGGRASRLVAGLPAAQYKLEVDGVARGTLKTGGEPGP